MPASPRKPVPRRSRWRTVSALSSCWWPVAIQSQSCPWATSPRQAKRRCRPAVSMESFCVLAQVLTSMFLVMQGIFSFAACSRTKASSPSLAAPRNWWLIWMQLRSAGRTSFEARVLMTCSRAIESAPPETANRMRAVPSNRRYARMKHATLSSRGSTVVFSHLPTCLVQAKKKGLT